MGPDGTYHPGSYRNGRLSWLPIFWVFMGGLLLAGCGEPDPWDSYKIEPPDEELQRLLYDSPYLYPEQSCSPVDESSKLPDNATTYVDEAGQEILCIWESVVGNVPEGYRYTDLASCEKAFTQAPSWFAEPYQVYESDASLMEDASFVAELDWAREQIESVGCACCHASATGSGNTSAFDVSAPQVWTDTISNYRLAMISGRFDEHRLFGMLEPETNHGFVRDHTMFPTTDPERMKAFFESEFERRGGTESDLELAESALQSFFLRLSESVSECVDPWEGLIDDRVVWSGTGGVRQFYVLEEGTETPGFPPNRDRPEGTVWAVYLAADQDPINSASIELGTVPEGAYQVIPENGVPPEFVPGRTYRLFATPDFQLVREINCTITYPSTNEI